MRDKLITERANAIQQELEAWAEETSILQPGERLTFSLRIERTATVVRDVGKDPLELSVSDFFTAKRLREAGVPKESHVRLINSVVNDCSYRFGSGEEGKTASNTTLREFLDARPDAKHMLRVPYFGKVCLKGFVQVLEASGIPDADRYAE